MCAFITSSQHHNSENVEQTIGIHYRRVKGREQTQALNL